MNVTAVETFDASELLERLRRTPLRGFDGAKPYAHASLELVTVDTDALAPAQRYVLAGSVQRALDLRDALFVHGVDLFVLDGGALIATNNAPDQPIPVSPPVVEESHEPDGRTVWIINDGLHRVFAARSLGLPITVVRISGVPRKYPYYALALPDGWDGVRVLDELPEVFQKKQYRIPGNYKALFRDFNAVLPGIQAQRKRSNPVHLRP